MTTPLVAKAQMLIRRPVAAVFEAFVDPAITCRFWFSRGSGALAPGARVRWDWEMYGVGTDVEVKAIEPQRRIFIVWNLTDPDGPTEVEWKFEPRDGDRTLATVENRGFSGTPEEQVAKALDSTGGFTFVLAGAKIWLEHAIEPRFVLDHNPDGLAAAWRDR
jgi:uncharacterized protein YndB with AHSA1/START domain